MRKRSGQNLTVTETCLEVCPDSASAMLEGTGIGLSLSRQIMRLHNGSLTLTKSDASSTVFTLIFK